MWPEQNQNTMRLDAIGDVAQPFTLFQLKHTLKRMAMLVVQGTASNLVLLNPVLEALREGRRKNRSILMTRRSVNPLIDALVQALTFDARDPKKLATMHASIRALPLVAIDALEDLLAYYQAVRPLLEAERLHRAGMLEGDWNFELGATEPDGKIQLRIRMKATTPGAQA